MNKHTRMTLQDTKQGAWNASLEYNLGDEQSITMRLLVPKSDPRMTVEQIEAKMLHMLVKFANGNLASLESNS